MSVIAWPPDRPLTMSAPSVAALLSLTNTSGGRSETPAVGSCVVVNTVRQPTVKLVPQPP